MAGKLLGYRLPHPSLPGLVGSSPPSAWPRLISFAHTLRLPGMNSARPGGAQLTDPASVHNYGETAASCATGWKSIKRPRGRLALAAPRLPPGWKSEKAPGRGRWHVSARQPISTAGQQPGTHVEGIILGLHFSKTNKKSTRGGDALRSWGPCGGGGSDEGFRPRPVS